MMRVLCLLVLLLVRPPAGLADGQPVAGQGPLLTAPAVRDSVRTNLWLVEALMDEIVREAAGFLPAAPVAVVLTPEAKSPTSDLFGVVATELLRNQGYQLYLSPDTLRAASANAARAPAAAAAADSAGVPKSNAEPVAAANVDSTSWPEVAPATATATLPPVLTAANAAALPHPRYAFRYRLEQVRLEYPDVGRRLGIWRQWVARKLVVSAVVKVVETETGRLLLNERLQRAYQDRVPARDFGAVRSDLYDFTDANLQDSGWRRRLEEIVVLGTLTGLVVIYFANTGN